MSVTETRLRAHLCGSRISAPSSAGVTVSGLVKMDTAGCHVPCGAFEHSTERQLR